MKKLTLTISILLLALYSYAQGISAGVKAGLNISNQNVSWNGSSIDTKAKVGIHLGGYAVIMLIENFGIQPEILFSMQGAKYPDYDGKTMFNYLNIPILARYNINEMFSVHAGPQIGFLLSAKSEDNGDKIDRKDEFDGIDIGGAIGVNAEWPSGINCGIRYVIGFSQISKDVEDLGEFKNNVFQLYAAYKLFNKEE
jgi:hypothetical protein